MHQESIHEQTECRMAGRYTAIAYDYIQEVPTHDRGIEMYSPPPSPLPAPETSGIPWFAEDQGRKFRSHDCDYTVLRLPPTRSPRKMLYRTKVTPAWRLQANTTQYRINGNLPLELYWALDRLLHPDNRYRQTERQTNRRLETSIWKVTAFPACVHQSTRYFGQTI